MAQLYGPAFAAAYGDSPSSLWESAIAGLTDDDCRKGLTRLANEAKDYPANLTEFVAACRYKPPVRYLGVPMTQEDQRKMLARPKASPEVVSKHLANIRMNLGRSNGGSDAT
jgi:hypothetical protein